MDEHDLRKLADSASQLVRPYLSDSQPLRTTLRLLAQWLLEEITRTEQAQTPAKPTVLKVEPGDAYIPPVPPAPPTPSPILSSPSLPPSAGIVPLKLGQTAIHLPVSGTTEELGRARLAAAEAAARSDEGSHATASSEIDLALIEERSRLKAESCRVLIERRACAPHSEEEFRARQRISELLAHGKSLPNCFLWAFWKEREQPGDSDLALIARTYDAHADAAALTAKADALGLDPQSAILHDVCQLFAEASSALRVALARTWLTKDDVDQYESHLWLRRETSVRGIRLRHYMSISDPADPENVEDLKLRVDRASRHLDERSSRVKSIKSATNQIRYHASQIVKNAPEDPSSHWNKIAEALTKLHALDVPSTDRRVVSALGAGALPFWNPDHTDAPVLLPLIEQARASEVAPDDDASSSARAWSSAVLEVRESLRGQAIAIIGGQRYADAVDRLLDAFQLKEVFWVPLSEHGSSASMRAPISRAETALVLVIIKLTGHLHADEARELAREFGKPCVLLSSGYNPEQVARAILDQASERLKT